MSIDWPVIYAAWPASTLAATSIEGTSCRDPDVTRRFSASLSLAIPEASTHTKAPIVTNPIINTM
jgi:hypothetical protein